MLPVLAREGARPYFEYLSYYPQECGYTRFLRPLEKGDVLVASPLLLVAPPPFRLHFQVDAGGRFRSPQVPERNERDLAEATCAAVGVPMIDVGSASALLERVAALVAPAAALHAVERIETCELDAAAERAPGQELPGAAPLDELGQRRAVEWNARQRSQVDAKLDARYDANLNNRALEPLAPPPAVEVGTLVPLWLGPAEDELFLVRRVTVDGAALLQGIWCDWPAWRASLLQAIAETVPGAGLAPLSASCKPTAETPTLTTIPAALVLPAALAGPPAARAAAWSATRTTLALAWLVVGGALVAGWFVVGSSVALAARRHRFASAVTHELRTPLTTFRLYSEMLADGMVREPAQRESYLKTLKEQSGRLAVLVENVLAYARLEERGAESRRARTSAAALLERHRPLLERRAQEAGFELACEVRDGAASLHTDADAVGQVLFNLVDNACKYAADAQPRRIELVVERHGAHVDWLVRDFGPGIPRELHDAVFRPFERGARNDDARPGVGLGLALARGIARDLGGELSLDPARSPGAALRLRLPLA